MYDEYVDRQGEVVTGIVQQAGDRNNVLVDLGKVEALLPRSEQVDGERYEQGSRIKAVIIEVRSGTKGPQVILSRRDAAADRGAVRARGARDRRRARRDPRRRPRAGLPLEDRGRVARPGRRSRSARASARAARACAWSSRSSAARRSTSSRGTRSRRGSSPRRSRRRACARSTSTTRRRDATVVVPDDQLALAIGKEGLNARLAARLTGLEGRHQVRHGVRPGRGRGRVRRRGRRRRGLLRPLRGAPLERQALPERGAPGSKYCGVPAHQALATDPHGAAERREPRSEAPSPRSRTPPTRSQRRRRTTDAAAEAGEPTVAVARGASRGRRAERLGAARRRADDA